MGSKPNDSGAESLEFSLLRYEKGQQKHKKETLASEGAEHSGRKPNELVEQSLFN